MQISADEKLMHCRFVLHSRLVLRGVPGDNKKKHNIYMAKHMERLSCPAALLKGDTNVVQMLFNTGSNRVRERGEKKGSRYITEALRSENRGCFNLRPLR